MAEKIRRDVFIPEEVVIHNFNNIKNLSVNIPDMLIVSGNNGAGKTSIAESICFVLTGEAIRDVKGKDLVRSGETEMKVSLTGKFTSASGTYDDQKTVITRTRALKKETVQILIGEGDKTIEVDNQEEFLQSIISPIDFRKLYYVNGHDIGAFIHGTASQYSEMLDKLFSISSLNDVIKEIKTNKLESDTLALRAKKQSLESKKILHEQSKKMIELKKGQEEEKKKLTEEIPELEKKKADLDKEVFQLDKEVSSLSTQVTSYKVSMKEKEDLDKRKSMLSDSIKTLESSKREIEASIESLKKEMSIESDGIDNVIETRLNECRDNLAKTEARIAVIKDLPKVLSVIMKIPVEGDICPLCQTPGKREDANKNIKAQASTLEIMNKKRNLLKEESSVLEDKRNKAKTLVSNLERVKNERMTVAKSYKEIRERLEAIPADSQGSILESNLSEISGGLRQKRDELSKVKFQIENDRQRLGKIGNEEDVNVIEWSDEDVKELVSTEENITNWTSKLQKLVDLKNGIREVLSTVRDKFITELNPDMAEKIKIFTKGNEHITKFEIKQSTTTRKGSDYYYYDFLVGIDGNDLPFESLSTGQRAVVLLSMILAVNDFSTKSLSMIVFDEIDNAGMDNDALKMILKAILTLAKNLKVIFINRDKRIIEFIEKATEAEDIKSELLDCKFGMDMDSTVKTLE